MKTIKGIGTDIIEIERIRKVFDRKGKAFLDKIFTKNEIEYCFKFKNPFPSLAARFAAKEATVKSLGVGFGKKVSFKDIEVLNDENGKPYVLISRDLKELFDSPFFHLSISHSNTNAVAFVVFVN